MTSPVTSRRSSALLMVMVRNAFGFDSPPCDGRVGAHEVVIATNRTPNSHRNTIRFERFRFHKGKRRPATPGANRKKLRPKPVKYLRARLGGGESNTSPRTHETGGQKNQDGKLVVRPKPSNLVWLMDYYFFFLPAFFFLAAM